MDAEEAEVERFYEDLQDLLELTPKKDVFFIIGNWNAKVGSQDTPGITGKFGLGIHNEAGQRLIEFCQRAHGHSKQPLPTTQKKTTHEHHQMVITKIRLIMFIASKDGKSISQSVSSVAQSCPTLSDPLNRRTPDLPVHHQLLGKKSVDVFS